MNNFNDAPRFDIHAKIYDTSAVIELSIHIRLTLRYTRDNTINPLQPHRLGLLLKLSECEQEI